MSWKNHSVATELSSYRVTGHKVRNLAETVAEFNVVEESSRLHVGVINSRDAKGGRGADVIRFFSYDFNGVESVSRSLSEAVAQVIGPFESGATIEFVSLFDFA